MKHNDDSILKIPGLLSKYKNSDLITAYKARFILYFCISCIIAIVTITFYSAYIQIHEPGIRFLDYSILGVELVILLLFILILILLVKGYFTFSANMLIISGITGTWIIIFLDKLHYLAKLDSIVFIFVIVTMTPLVVKRRSFVLVLYSLCNIPALFVLFHIQREQLDIPFNIKLDYIADVSIALLILAVILWNIFYINRTALEKLENDVKAKAESEKIEDFQTTIKCKNGDLRIISWYSNNLSDYCGMPEGGTLAIETSMIYLDDDYCRLHPQLTPGNYVMLSLSDTGTGMSKEIQEHIFEPFFTTKETGKGTGLGLATVYGAVKQNNGAIEVYSEVHHGTTFKIFFPCVEDTISVSDSKNFYFPEGNETILVVEDNTHVIEFVHDILKRLGYNILSSLNGQEALKQSEDYDGIIHLLLTDVILPGMNGKILAEQIKKLRPDIKIIFNSGYTGDIISRSGIIEEGFHFISKPFSAHELSHKIRAIMDK